MYFYQKGESLRYFKDVECVSAPHRMHVDTTVNLLNKIIRATQPTFPEKSRIDELQTYLSSPSQWGSRGTRRMSSFSKGSMDARKNDCSRGRASWGAKKYQIMHFGIKSQGEGQGGCKSKCLHPEMERGGSGRNHAAPIDAERAQ